MNISARLSACVLALALPLIASQPAAACGDTPILGEVCTFAFNFCPNGFLPADGRQYPIAQNQALYSLLGTTFGGDGRSTFGVPDLRGRAVVGTGQGLGLSNVIPGQMRGAEAVALNTAQMPAHTHVASVTQPSVALAVNAKAAPATAGTPAAGMQLGDSGRSPVYVASSTAGNNVALSGVSATASGTTVTNAPAGNSQPVPTVPPELGMTVCIAAQGIYPQRP
jgi:microcystin-dependent protein